MVSAASSSGRMYTVDDLALEAQKFYRDAAETLSISLARLIAELGTSNAAFLAATTKSLSAREKELWSETKTQDATKCQKAAEACEAGIAQLTSRINALARQKFWGDLESALLKAVSEGGKYELEQQQSTFRWLGSVMGLSSSDPAPTRSWGLPSKREALLKAVNQQMKASGLDALSSAPTTRCMVDSSHSAVQQLQKIGESVSVMKEDLLVFSAAFKEVCSGGNYTQESALPYIALVGVQLVKNENEWADLKKEAEPLLQTPTVAPREGKPFTERDKREWRAREKRLTADLQEVKVLLKELQEKFPAKIQEEAGGTMSADPFAKVSKEWKGAVDLLKNVTLTSDQVLLPADWLTTDNEKISHYFENIQPAQLLAKEVLKFPGSLVTRKKEIARNKASCVEYLEPLKILLSSIKDKQNAMAAAIRKREEWTAKLA